MDNYPGFAANDDNICGECGYLTQRTVYMANLKDSNR